MSSVVYATTLPISEAHRRSREKVHQIRESEAARFMEEFGIELVSDENDNDKFHAKWIDSHVETHTTGPDEDPIGVVLDLVAIIRKMK